MICPTAQKIIPPKIDLKDRSVTFGWQNGTESTITYKKLRGNCKCAICIDEHTEEQIQDPQKVSVDIKILEVFPLGNYAISIRWDDGHSSSIYPYKQLKELAEDT